MQVDDLTIARSLLLHQRILSLAVLVDGEPCSGLLPFAAATDLQSVLVHASRLARHTRGLAPGARYSAVVHKPDGPEVDVLRVPRLFLDGEVEMIDKATSEYARCREQYEGKLPSAAPLFSLGDFNLFRLSIEKVRLVAGFGRAVRIKPDKLTD